MENILWPKTTGETRKPVYAFIPTRKEPLSRAKLITIDWGWGGEKIYFCQCSAECSLFNNLVTLRKEGNCINLINRIYSKPQGTHLMWYSGSDLVKSKKIPGWLHSLALFITALPLESVANAIRAEKFIHEE